MPGSHATGCLAYADEHRRYVPTLYTSDTHLSHTNIIKYTRRPFASKAHMDSVLARHLTSAVAQGARLIHCGDLTFDLVRFVEQRGPLWGNPTGHLIVLGNHDRTHPKAKRVPYDLHFEHVIGSEKTWRDNTHTLLDVLDGVPVMVLLSHAPQQDLKGCDLNVHGHIHNSALLAEAHHTEDHWTFDSPVHFNASVELHGFKPVSLEALAAAHRAHYIDAMADVV